MDSVALRVRWAGILAILALTAAAAACGEDSAPAPTAPDTSAPSPSVTEAPAATDTTTPAATDTTTPAASTSAPEPSAPEPPTAVGELDIDIDEDTILRGVFDAFADSEQACIRDALDDELLESVLDMPVLSDDTDESMVQILLSCLAPETAREFFLSTITAGMIADIETEGLSTEIGMDEEACIRERLADIDVASMVDAVVSESDDSVILFLGLLGCVPDLLIESMLAEDGVEMEELAEEQRSCLGDLIADTDWIALAAELESDDSALFGFSLGLIACVPELLSPDSVSDSSSTPRTDIADDHANSLEEATPVTVGEPAPGEIDPDGDVDFFVFEGEEGELYQIDVTLGTLSDSVATLYDSDGSELERNDDHGDTLASRIYWEAQHSGNHYVAVEGWSGTGSYTLGSYTLTVAVADIANSLEEATPVTVGEPAPGEIDPDGDVDFFVFEGEEGELYQIDVTLGTLSDSVATLYDSDGSELERNDDHGDTLASRIYWEAQHSGNHYVAVEGWSGTGSYTLTVAVADIANSLEEATPVTVGEPAPGEIDPDGDVDFFVFEGEEGELYQIDVTLGTLSDSVATLYDSDGSELERNDDHGDTLASRIYWEAQHSGNHYVAVEGWSGTGSYTLTIVTR